MKEQPSFNPEKERPIVEEISGRSMLETDRELAMLDKEIIENKNGSPSREIIHDSEDPEGRVLYEKRWDYWREKNPAGEDEDTLKLKSVSERRLEYGDRRHSNKPTREIGRHLAREHAWINNYEYNEAGDCTRSYGEVTEGEKKGEKWEETKTYEQVGEFIKVASINTSEQPDVEQKRTVKVEYHDQSGKSVYGEKMTIGKPETHHTWGTKPKDLPDILLE